MTERLELMDNVAGLAVVVHAGGVEVGAEVVESGGGVGEEVPDDARMDRATATRALSLPRRLTRRR